MPTFAEQIDKAGALMLSRSFDQADAALLQARPLADNLDRRMQLANLQASLAVYRGDFPAATAALTAVLPEALAHPEGSAEFWLHNCLTWVRWAAGDLAGALAETGRQRAALDRLVLPADDKAALLLHALWDRAYLLAERANAEKGETRQNLWHAAEAARTAYESKAAKQPDHDAEGVAVLGALFAVRAGHGAAARAAVSQLDPAQVADVQDLYVIALALEAGGDAAGAAAVRQQIRQRKKVYLALPIYQRQLDKDAADQAARPAL